MRYDLDVSASTMIEAQSKIFPEAHTAAAVSSTLSYATESAGEQRGPLLACSHPNARSGKRNKRKSL